MTIFIILFCVLSPLFILWLTYKSSLLNKVGSIIVAYIIACTLGLLGVFPDTDEVHGVQTTIASAIVPFAIPLMIHISCSVAFRARLMDRSFPEGVHLRAPMIPRERLNVLMRRSPFA